MENEACKPAGSNNESKIENLFLVYDKLNYHLNQAFDHYFKRTQILMIAIQFGLVTAFVKLLTIDFGKSKYLLWESQAYYMICVIAILGVVFACIWHTMIQRHWNVFEYNRCYMRYIEKQLMDLGVGLAIYRAESAISYHHHPVIFDNCKQGRKGFFQTEFPYDDSKAKVELAGLEKFIALFIGLIWLIGFEFFLFRSISKFNLAPCLTILIIIVTLFIIATIIRYIEIVIRLMNYLSYKLAKKNEEIKSLRFSAKLSSLDLSKKDDVLKFLRPEFEENHIQLSQEAEISVEKPEHKWRITDTDIKGNKKKYYARKARKQIKIYGKTSILFWNLKEDLPIVDIEIDKEGKQ